ncbi:unnamed protein product [Ectocarpus sp. 12 AP-2014]
MRGTPRSSPFSPIPRPDPAKPVYLLPHGCSTAGGHYEHARHTEESTSSLNVVRWVMSHDVFPAMRSSSTQNTGLHGKVIREPSTVEMPENTRQTAAFPVVHDGTNHTAPATSSRSKRVSRSTWGCFLAEPPLVPLPTVRGLRGGHLVRREPKSSRKRLHSSGSRIQGETQTQATA